jgi:predicted N-acetyltransferase YhbS
MLGGIQVGYEFSFYKEEDFEEIEQLVLASYNLEYPVWGLSRQEFTFGLHPAFTGHYHAFEHTVGVYKEGDKIVAVVMNEGNYDGEVFFLFDSQERGEDRELLIEMIKFSKTNASGIKEDRRTRYVKLHVPEWNQTLLELVEKSGFTKEEWGESLYILPFKEESFEVKLPEGYTFADGNTTPDFYLSNTHRLSFGYGADDYACDHGEQAFHDLRLMKHYRKDLDICVLDELKRPVAMAIIWYVDGMPYCELEPLAVVWWERRKGIATALLHEAANRVMKLSPTCTGMLGGDQQYYRSIGYEKKAVIPRYYWELEVFISWEKESYGRDYANEM